MPSVELFNQTISIYKILAEKFDNWTNSTFELVQELNELLLYSICFVTQKYKL